MNYYLEVLKKYAVFSGRARRKEYWMFTLFYIIIFILLGVVQGVLGMATENGGILTTLYSLALLIPTLAVSVRRLHDINRSGWWLLIGLVPLVGIIILLIFTVQDGLPGENKYGPNPKEVKVD